MVVMTKYGTGV